MSAMPTLLRMIVIRMVCLAVIAGISIGGIYRISAADSDSDVIAIGVLLEPETNMVRYLQATNADLLRHYPRGYLLDGDRCPRITLAQRFVRVSDLPAVIESVAFAAEEERASTLQLTTDGYDYELRNPGGIGVMSLNVEVSPLLRNLEERIVNAVQPYAVSGGTADAFITVRGDVANKETIDWVEYFVPEFSGRSFSPQLPVGVAPAAYLESVKAKPFVWLTFGVTGVAIYQLNAHGTPQERIWDSGGIDPCACPPLYPFS